jgi:anti-sigma B factor antagonist
MEALTTSYKRCEVIKLSGRIDSEAVPTLRETVNPLLNNFKYNLVFDMSNVGFVSSSGWWVFIDTQKTCKKNNGEVVLVGLEERILKSLELVGMSGYFRIFDHLTDAVGDF